MKPFQKSALPGSGPRLGLPFASLVILAVAMASCSPKEPPTSPSYLVCLVCIGGGGGGDEADSVKISTLGFPFPEDSSFTTQSSENLVSIGATLTGALGGLPVQWTVVDDPTDDVESGVPATPTAGQQSTLLIPGPLTASQQPDTSRWVAFIHPGALNQKSLAYQLTASVIKSDGSTVASIPVIVRQHEKDTMRQEYIDFGIADIMPPRTELRTSADVFTSRHFTFAALTIRNDYSVAFLSDALITHLDDLWDSVGSALPVNSGFRNPVHHRFHIPRRPGARLAARSNHQSGNAADLDVQRDLYRWRLVQRRAYQLQMCVEPEATSTLSHIHVDWRGGRRYCPVGW